MVQPALFAVMVGLAAVWASFGVRPDAVVGHSQGEIAAACVAGALSLEDAARVVALRSRAIGSLVSGGGMLAVGLGVGDVRVVVEEFGGGGVSVAAVNSPGSTVLSGDVGVLGVLEGVLVGRGVRVRRIPVSYASHGPQVESLREHLLEVLGGVRPRGSVVPFYSTVTGGVLDTSELSAGYWFRNLRQPVELVDAVSGLVGDGFAHFVEVSPHPGLVAPLQEILDGVSGVGVVHSTLRRGDDSLEQVHRAVAHAFVHGLDPVRDPAREPYSGTVSSVESGRVSGDGSGANSGASAGAVLPVPPTYPFEHHPYWLTTTVRSGKASEHGFETTDHALLTATTVLGDEHGALLTGRISLPPPSRGWPTTPSPGTSCCPAAAFVDLALHTATRHTDHPYVSDLTIEAPLALAAGSHTRLQVIVGAVDGNGRRSLDIYSPAGERRPGHRVDPPRGRRAHRRAARRTARRPHRLAARPAPNPSTSPTRTSASPTPGTSTAPPSRA